MKQHRRTIDVSEPLGIVIADGARAEVTPRFSAFVWGPAPDAVPSEAVEPASEPRAA